MAVEDAGQTVGAVCPTVYTDGRFSDIIDNARNTEDMCNELEQVLRHKLDDLVGILPRDTQGELPRDTQGEKDSPEPACWVEKVLSIQRRSRAILSDALVRIASV